MKQVRFVAAGAARLASLVLAVALASARPARADLQLGPESGTDRGPLTAARAAQESPATVWTGTHHFVVWLDAREQYRRSLYGARVGADGTVLDPTGRLITLNGSSFGGRLAWNGQNHMLLWGEGTGGTATGQLKAGRVDPEGRLLDPAGLVIRQGPGEIFTDAAIAWNGSQHLVVWTTHKPPTGLFAARLSVDGTVLDPTPITIVQGNVVFAAPSVAGGGDQFLIAWSSPAGPDGFATLDVFATRVSSEGKLLDPITTPLVGDPGRQGSPRVLWQDGKYLITYSDDRPDMRGPRGLRIAADGTRPDAAGFSLLPPTAMASTWAVSKEGLLAWRDVQSYPGQLWLGRLSTAAAGPAASPASLLSLSNGAELASLSLSGGPRPLAVWSQRVLDAAQDWDILGARVDEAGRTMDAGGFRLSVSARAQPAAAIASNDSEFLLAFTEETTPDQVELYATRVIPGAAGPPTRIPLREGSGVSSETAVAWNGSHWLVAWAQRERQYASSSAVMLARLDGKGALVAPPSVLAPAAGMGGLQLASDGRGYLLVGHRHGGATDVDIAAVLLSPDGTTIGTAPVPVAAEPRRQLSPRAVWNGQTYLTVWADDRHGEPSVYAARVTTDGTVLDRTGIPVARTLSHDRPAIAWNGSHHLVAWREPEGQGVLRGARLTIEGQLMDAQPLALGGARGQKGGPQLVVHDGAFILAWRELLVPGPSGFGLYVTRLSPEGLPLDAPGIEVIEPAPGPGFEAPLMAVAGQQGLVGTRTFNRNDGHERVRWRLFTQGVAPDAGAVVPDAGEDARHVEDAADAVADVPDAASPADGGADAGKPPARGDGCSCRLGGGQSGPAPALCALVLLALIGWRRHRRAQRCR